MLKALLKSEVIISAICAAAALYLFFETQTFANIDVYGGKLGSDFWPRLILVSMMALSAGLAYNTIKDVLKGKIPEANNIKFSSANIRFIAAVALIATYLGLLPVIGFLVLTPVMMIAFMYLLGERSKAWIFSIPFVLTLGIVLVFTKLMYVPLPRGMGIFLKISHLLY
ncbi:MAG: tripartite tricarboxylate transporter TctB family protein [Deltaproteobacteria bacterium]|uniref:tripartite tricarboxylate transporter TctB family protein n=1 Tax=Desulfobacula sp. TaxID=2593537 RepID=UPI0019C6C407|nr:tripartite tricarboxylate transporter TctB family protein [Candidatus Desulfobacula maris]MBL6992454.1 tripartite tricarboxylate transporter TctB family protein [Desulfobacula sp.]